MAKRLCVKPAEESTKLSSPMFWKQEFVICGQPMILEITDEDCAAIESQFEGFFKCEDCK